jgi:hypothetical protein
MSDPPVSIAAIRHGHALHGIAQGGFRFSRRLLFPFPIEARPADLH